jgi:hypothetical protein
MSLHALLPLQVTLQRELPWHVTSWHAPSPVHVIVQVQPDGQVTSESHRSSVVHSTAQVR